MRSTLIPVLFVLATSVSAGLFSSILETIAGNTPSSTTTDDTPYTYTRTTVIPVTSVSASATIVSLVPNSQTAAIGSAISSEKSSSYLYNSPYTSYVVPITYKPSPSCTEQNWTFTSTVPVRAPSITSLAQESVYTTVFSYSYQMPTTRVVAVLNPKNINASDLASASSNYAPYGLDDCYTPTTYCATVPTESCTTRFVLDQSTSSSGTSGSISDYFSQEDHWINTMILIAILVPVGWIVIWFFIGLWENWMSFEGLMLGLDSRRGLPYSWCLISLWALCFVGPRYKAKSDEERAELLIKWKGMKKSEKFKLWIKLGFRWKYPDVNGVEPEFEKRALRQRCF